MTLTWDIVQDVFSTTDLVTRPQMSSRRPASGLSSMLQSMMVVSLASAAPLSSGMLISDFELSRTSKLQVILKRSPISVRKLPSREKRPGIDFERGRSAEKLANSFAGYFKPAQNIDEPEEDGFVF